jgi:hypothetical protein
VGVWPVSGKPGSGAAPIRAPAALKASTNALPVSLLVLVPGHKTGPTAVAALASAVPRQARRRSRISALWSATTALSVPLRHCLTAISGDQAESRARSRTTAAAGVRYARFRWRDHRLLGTLAWTGHGASAVDRPCGLSVP